MQHSTSKGKRRASIACHCGKGGCEQGREGKGSSPHCKVYAGGYTQWRLPPPHIANRTCWRSSPSHHQGLPHPAQQLPLGCRAAVCRALPRCKAARYQPQQQVLRSRAAHEQAVRRNPRGRPMQPGRQVSPLRFSRHRVLAEHAGDAASPCGVAAQGTPGWQRQLRSAWEQVKTKQVTAEQADGIACIGHDPRGPREPPACT